MTYPKSYALLLARTVDIMLCGWIWRDYDITISSMCGLELRKPTPRGWARVLGGFLNWLQPGHCEHAITADLERVQEAERILTGVAKP